MEIVFLLTIVTPTFALFEDDGIYYIPDPRFLRHQGLFKVATPIGDKKCIDFKAKKVRTCLNICRVAASSNYRNKVNS